jgi:hypothetical protein
LPNDRLIVDLSDSGQDNWQITGNGVRPQARLPQSVGGHGIKVAKTGVREHDGRCQPVEQGDFGRCEFEFP